MAQTYIIFFGPPGCGKGVQARKARDEFGLVHLSTGDLLRENVRAGTPLGQEAQQYMVRGELVPDELILRIVRDRLQQPDCVRGAIFDGFPRTRAQAEALDALLAEVGSGLALVIEFVLPLEVSRQRLLARAKKENRADDRPEVIEKRLADHQIVHQSVIPYYQARGLIRQVDADRSIEAIYADVRALIQGVLR